MIQIHGWLERQTCIEFIRIQIAEKAGVSFRFLFLHTKDGADHQLMIIKTVTTTHLT